MSIYENRDLDTKSTKRKNNDTQKVDPKKILNDKNLTSFIKEVTNFKGTAKEIIYDMSRVPIGVLQKNNTPYLFSDAERKEFISKKDK